MNSKIDLSVWIWVSVIFTLGIAIGMSIVIILDDIYLEDYYIKKILKEQQDCRIADYYYLPHNIDFCHKIGVKP